MPFPHEKLKIKSTILFNPGILKKTLISAATSPILNQANPIHHDPSSVVPTGTGARFPPRRHPVAGSVATCEHSSFSGSGATGATRSRNAASSTLRFPNSVPWCTRRCIKKAALSCLRCPHRHMSGRSPSPSSSSSSAQHRVGETEQTERKAVCSSPSPSAHVWVSVDYRGEKEA